MADKAEIKVEARKTAYGDRWVVIFPSGREEVFITEEGAQKWKALSQGSK